MATATPATATLASLWAEPRRYASPADADHDARQRRIRAVALLASGHWSADRVARLEGISRRTLFRWRADVIEAYDDPEALAVRRQLGLDRESA